MSNGELILQRIAHALLWLLSRLPLSWVHGLGTICGVWMSWLPNRQRRNALLNLAVCFPEMPFEQLRDLRNRSLREFGKTYLEIAHLWQRPVADVLNLVSETQGIEALRPREGRGLIVLSPHLGAWELAGLYLAAQGPTVIFYKPQKQLDALILAARKRSGATLAPITTHGIRRLIQALKRGEQVGILPDQAPRADKGAAFAPLFGVPAYTMLLVNRLAQTTGADVVFLFAERLTASTGYRMHCVRAPSDVAAADPIVAATALNQGIEHCVRRCPEQYLWTYRRFRERPAGIPKLYQGALDDAAAWEQAQQFRAAIHF